MTFAMKLQTLRKKNGYSQEYLAEQCGVSRQAVSKWESDLAYPETDKIIYLSQLLGVSTDYLVKDDAEAADDATTPQQSDISYPDCKNRW
mgnify:CR=1 FL=1